MTTFAKRITAARKEKKLTQEQVAQVMGVSRQTVSHPRGRPAAHAAAPAYSGRRRAGCVRHDSGDGGVSDL